MMTARDEEAQILRALRLRQARDLCRAWGYWCIYGQWGETAGQRPFVTGYHGGIERRYRSPPQWHPPEPRMPEADENAGMAVQRAYVCLPERSGARYRSILRAEYCVRPWLVGTREGEVEYLAARRARVSVGAYDQVLSNSLWCLINIMRFKGLWRGA